jgi:hypothetical protein
MGWRMKKRALKSQDTSFVQGKFTVYTCRVSWLVVRAAVGCARLAARVCSLDSPTRSVGVLLGSRDAALCTRVCVSIVIYVLTLESANDLVHALR